MSHLHRTARPRKRWRARIRNMMAAARNAPLFVLCCLLSLSIEGFAIGGIYMTHTETVPVFGMNFPIAHLLAAISMGFGITAIVVQQTAASLRADPRPEIRRRWRGAQFVSIALLGVPVHFAGESFAIQDQRADAREYRASEAYRVDLAVSQDPRADAMLRRDALSNIAMATAPERARFDLIAWAWAALLYGLNLKAADAGWRPLAETDRQAERRERRMARAAAARRKAERQRWRRKIEAPSFWERVQAVFAPPAPPPADFDLRGWVGPAPAHQRPN